MKKDKAVLQLCGLGSRPPEETTCEALQALDACRVVFTDVEPELASWLRGFTRKLVVLPAKEADAAKAKRIAAELAKGGTVGVAVWGHPMMTSPLCLELLRRAKGAQVRVPGAVSPIGSAFARSVSFFGGDYGFHAIQACDLTEAASAKLDSRMPLVVFSARPGEAAGWEKLTESLKGNYPAAHKAFLYPAGVEGGSVALSEVSARVKTAASAVLLVPPAPGAELKRTR